MAQTDSETLTGRAPTSPIDVYTRGSSNPSIEIRAIQVPAAGTVPTLKITTSHAVARTAGTMKSVSINMEPGAYEATAITAAEICTYMGSSVTVTGTVTGLFVETQGGGTLGGEYVSLQVYSAPGADPTAGSYVMELESNPATVTWVDAFINMVGNPNFTFKVSAQGTSSSPDGSKATGADGWMLVDCGGETKYIQLYNGA